MTYEGEIRPLLVDVGLKFERAEMQMIRWMCGIPLKELRRLVGVEPITTFIRSRVEGRRLVGRPRNTWLESIEVDMAELRSPKKMSMIEVNGEGI